MRASRGFTLIELMISLVLFSFAIAGALSIAVSLTNGYREQRQAVETEMSVRAPMDFLSDAVRSAVPGIPTGAWVSGVTGTACDSLPCNAPSGAPSTSAPPPPVSAQKPLVLTVQDTQTCQFGAIWTVDNTNAPDELYVTYASGAVVTRIHQQPPYNPYKPSVDTTFGVMNSAGILPGDYLLVVDSNNSQGTIVQVSPTWVNTGPSTAGTPVTLVAPNCASGAISDPSGTGYADGSLVIRAYRAHFYIDTTSYANPYGGIIPTLMMDPDGRGLNAEPLAENIEDMQIALGIDVDNNGTIDPTEWAYSLATPGALAGPVRAVRITLTAKAPQALIGTAAAAAFQRKAAENRPIGGFDAYRRRTLTSTIEIRNTRSGPPGGAR
ncbi:MAG TPA: PilW family protein [Kofleriaceae bacterium]|nr:PilW family protein [Kofleriaceae bacterium]